MNEVELMICNGRKLLFEPEWTRVMPSLKQISIIASEASFLVCSMHGFSICIFQAVRRAVNVLNVSTCI